MTIRVGRTRLPDGTRGWIREVANGGFSKLIENAERGAPTGATSSAPVGGEVLGALAVAVPRGGYGDGTTADDLRLPGFPSGGR